jgi:N-acylneuraminate cytidylyltransferase
MSNNGKVPALILARAGSKGIKDKNIINFCGKPLLAWSILQAKCCEFISNVYVSTNGDSIAEVAEEYGAKVIRRPSILATDKSTSEEAINHAIQVIAEKESFEMLVFLQATSPIRRDNDIYDAIKKYTLEKYDSLFSMTVLDDYCLWSSENGILRSISYDYRNRGRRQERNPLYLENGSIYIFSKDVFVQYNNRLGGKIGMYEMPFECSYEIDTYKDLPICEYFMKKMLGEC